LKLLGSYEGGLKSISDPKEREKRISENLTLLREKVNKLKPHVALVGNIDMLGPEILHELVNLGLPCFHHHTGFQTITLNQQPIPKGTQSMIAA
ncbi:MAG: hypothetical protein VX438_12395, partial [Planctomycetota bacterium]|nr:hypothetical protein [Planctomycetota bacterium]